MRKNIIISLASLATLLWFLPACTPNEPAMEDLALMEESKIKDFIADGDLYNLQQFKDSFMTEKGNFMSDNTPYRTRSYYDGLYLFSIDTIPTNGRGIYIRGRVVTDDYGGNFYKSLVIQQTTDWKTGKAIDQQALRISLDMGSAGGLFHQGQEIIIRCNGLAIGRYANQPQLCTPSYNNNIYAGSAAQKVGWAPGRIPSPRFRQACKLVGKPDVNKIVYDVISVDSLYDRFVTKYEDVKGARDFDARLVRVVNGHFTGKFDNQGTETPCNRWDPKDPSKGNPELDGNAYVFGPTTGNVGYPQSRYFGGNDTVTAADGTKHLKQILVSTSEYAKYAYYYLPDSIYVGSVTGVLGYYMDNGFYDPDGGEWSITPCDLSNILPECQKENANPRWKPVEWQKGVAQP